LIKSKNLLITPDFIIFLKQFKECSNVAKLYRITPLEKKSVIAFYDVFERLADGSTRGWTVEETWRWGQGFRELDEEVWEFEADTKRMHGVHCRANVGWGCELDDLCATWFQFDDSYTEEEQQEIKDFWHGDKEDEDGRSGAAWLFDGDHNWEIEDDHIRILPPLKIDIVDEEVYNECIEENILPYKPEPDKTNIGWPFPEKDAE
jgi:hypothetical protein